MTHRLSTLSRNDRPPSHAALPISHALTFKTIVSVLLLSRLLYITVKTRGSLLDNPLFGLVYLHLQRFCGYVGLLPTVLTVT